MGAEEQPLFRTVLVTVWIVALAPVVEAGVETRTTPAPMVLDVAARSVEISVRGLPGTGPVHAAVNVGRVDAVESQIDGARLLYITPEGTGARMLCLLLWREGSSEAHVARLPLHGRVDIPLGGRSVVTVSVDGSPHAPVLQRRDKVTVDVPPGARQVEVLLTDRAGRPASRTVDLPRVPYNRLALLAAGGSVAVATATVRPGEQPLIEVDGERLELRRTGLGLWLARPGQQSDLPHTARVRAWLPDGAVQEAVLRLTPSMDRTRGPTSRPRQWRGIAGMAVGMLHNTGELLAPRFSAELGLELQLPVGWIGVRALVGVSWGNQTIEGPVHLGEGRSRVLLLPVGAVLAYRLPLSVLTPYVMAGLQAQLVRAETSGGGLEQTLVDSEWITAFIGLAGVELPFGPGGAFLQAGFQWGRLDQPRIEMLAGGVVIEVGYRFRL